MLHWHLHCQVVDAERPSQASSTSWLHAVLLAQILDAAEQLRGQGWEYDLDAAFVEVYNEGLRDLLAEGGRGARRRAHRRPERRQARARGRVAAPPGPRHHPCRLRVCRGSLLSRLLRQLIGFMAWQPRAQLSPCSGWFWGTGQHSIVSMRRLPTHHLKVLHRRAGMSAWQAGALPKAHNE